MHQYVGLYLNFSILLVFSMKVMNLFDSLIPNDLGEGEGVLL